MDPITLTNSLAWLSKRTWGLSFLLALASSCVLIFFAARHPGGQLDYVIQGPVFRLGSSVGAFFSADAFTGMWFGIAADFLLLLSLWFLMINVVLRLRAGRQGATTS